MICHVTVNTHDLKSSIEFYSWLLGLPVARRFPTPEGEIAFLGSGETKLELIESRGYHRTAPADGISVGFGVDNLEEKIALLAQREIPVSPVTSPAPGTRFCFFTDLNGIRIQLIEQK